MKLADVLKSISKKLLIIILSIVVLLTIAYLIWQKKKYRVVNAKIATTIAKKTDSIYKVTYDSIHFDALTGKAFVRNIHIGPDLNVVKNRKPDELPFLLLDVKIQALKINGVQTDKALLSQQIVGDSVIIDNPDINIYFIKHLQKQTKIETEAGTIYDEILGNLDLIKVNHVFINNIHINGYDFFSKNKEFTINHAAIQLTNVLIDSAHNLDTTRTLFCKQIALQLDSFVKYNNAREEVFVKQMNYSGADNLLAFTGIKVNRFESETGSGIPLIYATSIDLKGIDANEIVKNKNLLADTIECGSITINQPRVKDVKKTADTLHTKSDTTGFMYAYSLELQLLHFPKITFIPLDKNVTLGNISFFMKNIKADEVMDAKLHPLTYSKEAQVSCDKISMTTKDKMYNYLFQNVSINSLRKELKVDNVLFKPLLNEKAFADKAHYQRDRYDVALSGISLKNINMEDFLSYKISAGNLVINNTSAKIYTDLTRPSNGKSKVGNYPSEMLAKLKFPITISKGTLSNAFIQYTEHEIISDSSGIVTFNDSKINIDNITNVPAEIAKNNAVTISYNTKVLNTIPLSGSFKFFLNSTNGAFGAKGTASQFDALVLNKVAVPMALVRFKQGTFNSADFNLTGDDYGAKGDFVMKYNNIKVDVLRINKENKDISKKGLITFAANTIIKNDNPANGKLRTGTPFFTRNVQKSFFNLVWRTILTGMKQTMGVPGK